ncbi:MAG: hypothetical protein LBR56_01915 [Sporomusaceae bacterium]|nr:hypothetical protein [Sporomusaceae bacterium]
MKFKKRKGYAMLVNLLIVVMIMGTISSTLAMQQSAYFTGLESGRTALQAQQIAAAKANEVSVSSYFDATKTAEKRAVIPGTGFEREIIVGPEVDLGGNNKKRDITVNVYKPGEAQARFSLPVTLTSQGSSNKLFKNWLLVGNSGIADSDGILIATSGFNSDMAGYTSGVQRFYFSRRDKYGQGHTTATMPVIKGESWVIGGAQKVWFVGIGG